MSTLQVLQSLWYGLLIFLLVGFIALDGYDLGAGMWHLFAQRGRQRDQVLTTVAPFWDGNQVWLVAVGGAAFAAFPPVYGAVLSGLYPLLIVILLSLIIRTVSVEYAQKEHDVRRRGAWDVAFSLSSFTAVLGIGLLLGNLLYGLPLDEHGQVLMSFSQLLHPFALLIALLLVIMVAMHGATWLALKSEGALAEQARRWGGSVWLPYFPLAVVVTAALAMTQPQLSANYALMPGLWAVPGLAVIAVILSGAALAGRRHLVAFAASGFALVLFFIAGAVALFPRLVPALGDDTRSLTAYNASSSLLALEVMLVVAGVGMPIVLLYTAWVHWLFRERAPEHEYEGG